MTAHLPLYNAPQGVEKGTVVGMAYRGPLVYKALRVLFVDQRCIKALLI